MKRPTPDLSLKYWLLLEQRLSASSEGFTILETLMAILILAAVTGLIATPLMLTVGSRVQKEWDDSG
jgi:type II secretory pathway pseudopilin PulG